MTLTMTDLNQMDYDAIWAYERKLGFIGKLYGAVTHADNIRQEIIEKSVAPDAVMRANRSMWIYDTDQLIAAVDTLEAALRCMRRDIMGE